MSTDIVCTELGQPEPGVCPTGEMCGGCPLIVHPTHAPTPEPPPPPPTGAPTLLPTTSPTFNIFLLEFYETDAGMTTIYLGSIFFMITALCYRDRVRFLLKENDRLTRLAAREAHHSPKKGKPEEAGGKAEEEKPYAGYQRKKKPEIYCEAVGWLLARLACIPLCKLAVETYRTRRDKKRAQEAEVKGMFKEHEEDDGKGKKKKDGKKSSTKSSAKDDKEDEEFVDLT